VISDALLGAVVGAGATLGAQGLATVLGLRQSREQGRRQRDATALVNQDDFEHFQAMLLRALDRGRWWYSWEQSDPQATVDDRKTLWAALDPKPGECAANAQGWVDYLKAQRLAVCTPGPRPTTSGEPTNAPSTATVPSQRRTRRLRVQRELAQRVSAASRTHADTTHAEHMPRLTEPQATLIRNTFMLLEKARYAISLKTKRDFAAFAGLRVTATLEHHNSLDDLGLGHIDYKTFDANFITDAPAP